MRLRGTRESIIKRINELEVSDWVDGGTRAVFVEFSVYNAQVCRIKLELMNKVFWFRPGYL